MDFNLIRLLSTFFFLLTLFSGCAHVNHTTVHSCYPLTTPQQNDEHYLIIYVDAPRLDYTSNHTVLRSIAKHPRNGSKAGDVGHAWIYLKGTLNLGPVVIEGGHSGELGIQQAKYFDGVMNYLDYGYHSPTREQKKCPHYEPNPIKYLWATQKDGFFQNGSGGHTPSYGIKIRITPEQFNAIWNSIQPENYHYADYAITRNQCCSFVAQIATFAGLNLQYEKTIPIHPFLNFRGRRMQLWVDPQYASFTFGSPDVLEESLKKAVAEGKAESLSIG